MSELQTFTLAVLHQFVQLKVVSSHSCQRIRLFLNPDRLQSMGAARLPNVTDPALLPPNILVLEVEPSQANSQVPAGFYKLPEDFARKDLKEISDWLVGR